MAGPPIQGQPHDGPSEPAKGRDGDSRDEQGARQGEPQRGASQREERRGQLPGERYVRIVRPHAATARTPEAAKVPAPEQASRTRTPFSRMWRRVRGAIGESSLAGYLLRWRGSARRSTGGAAIATPRTALPAAAVGPPRPRERVVHRTIIQPEKVVLQREIRYHRPMRAPLLLALGFALTILLGSLLLTLPIANREGTVTPYIVALFSATSAVCVTGLVVVDTLSYWTPFGQAVIALLIQVGGLGFMTASTFLLTLLGRRISLAERLLLKEAHGVAPLGGVIALTRNVVFVTVLIEGTGALILFLRFVWDYSPLTALWMGVFHAVSAFNNAGFDLVGDFRSLVPYNQDAVVVLAHALLIILGGISYTVLLNLAGKRGYRYLLLDTKLVLVTTSALLVVGTVGLWLMEHNNPATLGALSLPGQLLNAFFSATTPRTAGFNSVDVGKMTQGSLLLTIALMYVGAASGSTGGGIKVNTFAVLSAVVYSSARGKAAVTVFGRELPPSEVNRALSVALLALGLIFVVTLVLTVSEPFTLTQVLFETTSAFGTVGLSTGITPSLSLVGKLSIIATMYLGRVGPLTAALALAQRSGTERFKYPETHVKIG